MIKFLIGNKYKAKMAAMTMTPTMIQTTKDIGTSIRNTRKTLGITQRDLALTACTGLRFIIDLEKGKPTCQLAKTLNVLQTLGITIQFQSPSLATKGAP